MKKALFIFNSKIILGMGAVNIFFFQFMKTNPQPFNSTINKKYYML